MEEPPSQGGAGPSSFEGGSAVVSEQPGIWLRWAPNGGVGRHVTRTLSFFSLDVRSRSLRFARTLLPEAPGCNLTRHVLACRWYDDDDPGHHLEGELRLLDVKSISSATGGIIMKWEDKSMHAMLIAVRAYRS